MRRMRNTRMRAGKTQVPCCGSGGSWRACAAWRVQRRRGRRPTSLRAGSGPARMLQHQTGGIEGATRFSVQIGACLVVPSGIM